MKPSNVWLNYRYFSFRKMCDFKLSIFLLLFATLISFQENEASSNANKVINQWGELASSTRQRDLAVVAKMCGSKMNNIFNDLDSLKTDTNKQLSEVKISDDITNLAIKVKTNVNSSTKHLNDLRNLVYKVATRFRDSYKQTLSFSEITSESAYNRLNEMKKNPIDNTDPLPQLVTKLFSKKYDYNKLCENVLAVSLKNENVDVVKKKSTAQTEFSSLFNLLDKWSQNNNEVALKAMDICFKGISSLKEIHKNMRESSENMLADINEDDLSSIQNAIYVAKALNLELEDEISYDSGELEYDDELFKSKNKKNNDDKKVQNIQDPFGKVDTMPINEVATKPLNTDNMSRVLTPVQFNQIEDNAISKPIHQPVEQKPIDTHTPPNEFPNQTGFFNPQININDITADLTQKYFPKENSNDDKEGDKNDKAGNNNNKLFNYVTPLFNYVQQPWNRFSLKKSPGKKFDLDHNNLNGVIPVNDNRNHAFVEPQINDDTIMKKPDDDLNNSSREKKEVEKDDEIKSNPIDFGVPQIIDNAEKLNTDATPKKPQKSFWGRPFTSFLPTSLNTLMNNEVPNIEQNRNEDDKIHHSPQAFLAKANEDPRAEHHNDKLPNLISDTFRFKPNVNNNHKGDKEQKTQFVEPDRKDSEEVDIKSILNENPQNSMENVFTNNNPENDNLSILPDSLIEPTLPNDISPHNSMMEEIPIETDSNITPLTAEEKLNNNDEKKPKEKKRKKRRVTYLVNKLTGERTPIQSQIISDNDEDSKKNDGINSKELRGDDNSLASSLLHNKNAMQCKNKAFLEVKQMASNEMKKLIYTTILSSNNLRKTVTSLIEQAYDFIKQTDDSDQVDQVIEIIKDTVVNKFQDLASEVKNLIVSDATSFMENVSETKMKNSNGSPTTYEMLNEISVGPYNISDNVKKTLNMISPQFNIDEMLTKMIESSSLSNMDNLNSKKYESQKLLIDFSKLVNRIVNNFECVTFSTLNEVGRGVDVLKSIESGRVTISQNHPRAEILKNALGVAQEILNQETAINVHNEIEPPSESNSNQDNLEKFEETVTDNVEKSISNEKEVDIEDIPNNNTLEVGIISIQPDQTLKFKEISTSEELNKFISEEIEYTKKQGDNEAPTFLEVDDKETLMALVEKAEKNGMTRKKMIKKLKKKFKTFDPINVNI